MSDLTVTLAPDEANAVVYALTLAVLATGEHRGHDAFSTSPGDLIAIEKHASRISRLAAVNDQLRWRAHWGALGCEPPPAVTASGRSFIDVVAELHARAESQFNHGPDEEDGYFAFDQAARTLARAFAEAQAVPA